jgi:hypothetical protein
MSYEKLAVDEISLENYCRIVETTETISSIDIGSALIHIVKDENGEVFSIVNTACGRAAVIQ